MKPMRRLTEALDSIDPVSLDRVEAAVGVAQSRIIQVDVDPARASQNLMIRFLAIAADSLEQLGYHSTSEGMEFRGVRPDMSDEERAWHEKTVAAVRDKILPQINVIIDKSAPVGKMKRLNELLQRHIDEGRALPKSDADQLYQSATQTLAEGIMSAVGQPVKRNNPLDALKRGGEDGSRTGV